ncbi:hypothetical protein QAD02_017822 [Eretmocerus hayati]|uniref:Uncharacterized protein n=1 Tax=Eretmocerus hayati TaxID=131215 RepID=A0ACC2PEN4_9HYME|nr:hypothetical protein QAD02_017822 [Eretmocerus hayati]
MPTLPIVVLLALVGQLRAQGSISTTASPIVVPTTHTSAASRQEPDGTSKCLCQASSCLCCVELNLTSSIDLGGPACVNVRHVERNVSLNLSYSENPVHNATIALAQASRRPTCMNLLSDLAQICAEFTSMKPVEGSGSQSQEAIAYDGCLVIEPALLGARQATYPVGCFRLEQGLVRQIEGPVTPVTEEEQKPSDQEEEEDDEPGLNAEELIAAVSASAEQGIALFSQWLGINLSPRPNATVASTREEPHSNEPKTQEQRPLSARHARTMSLLLDHQDKNEERFKQLLSAQDNILREPPTIGEPLVGIRTSYLYSQPGVEEAHAPVAPATIIAPHNLAVVPTESRRGGRAYNIHQHVNEI